MPVDILVRIKENDSTVDAMIKADGKEVTSMERIHADAVIAAVKEAMVKVGHDNGAEKTFSKEVTPGSKEAENWAKRVQG